MNGKDKIRYRALSGYMEDSVSRIEGIDLWNHIGHVDGYLFTVGVLYRNDSCDECHILVGARDTWLEFNGIRYETLDDFGRLAVSLERKKIADMLEKM